MPEHNRNENIFLWIRILASLGLIAGFLYSRALVSIASGVLFAVAFFPTNYKNTIRVIKKYRFIHFTALYFIIQLTTYWWSEDKTSFWQIIQMKTLLLIMPIGIATLPYRSTQFKRWFMLGMIIMLSVNIIYSLSLYLTDIEGYNERYNHSKMIPTNIYNDHIRYSLLLSIVLLFLYWGWKTGFELIRKNSSWVYISVATLIVIYLHVLSAKTGLMSLYIILIGISLHSLSHRFSITKSILFSTLGFILLGISAYIILPTFKSKIDYVIFEYEKIKNGEDLDYNYSDMGRIISYHVAINRINEHKILGTGAGDYVNEMRKGYEKLYPEIKDENKLIPHNQLLTEVLSTGFILSIGFLFMIFSFIKIRKDKKPDFYSFLTFAVMSAAMLVEAMFQVQMGLMIYLLFSTILFFWNNEK